MDGRPLRSLLEIACDPQSDVQLHVQIFSHIRDAILAGRLPRGLALPASRKLSKQMAVSRNTVIAAYEKLVAEGYLTTRPGGGTYVSERLPEELLLPSVARPLAFDPTLGLSSRGEDIIAVPDEGTLHPGIFQPMMPETSHLPYDVISSLFQDKWVRPKPHLRGGDGVGGYAGLREAIASYLALFRGLACAAENVVITAGTTQSLHILSQILLDPGDSAWLENPGSRVPRAIMTAASVNAVPVPVDEEGISVEAGRRICPDARLAVVTPARQFPLGATMSPRRREALLSWAHQSRAWILEDDFDSEFRYAGQPVPTLKSADSFGNVILLGTFSKTLHPALRLGYMVLPQPLVKPVIEAFRRLEQGPTLMLQPVVAALITEGHFGSHVRRRLTDYRRRRDAMIEAFDRHLSDIFDYEQVQSGMHLTAFFRTALPSGLDDREVAARLNQRRIGVLPLSAHYHGAETARQGLLVGFASTAIEDIGPGVEKMADVLRPLVVPPATPLRRTQTHA